MGEVLCYFRFCPPGAFKVKKKKSIRKERRRFPSASQTKPGLRALMQMAASLKKKRNSRQKEWKNWSASSRQWESSFLPNNMPLRVSLKFIWHRGTPVLTWSWSWQRRETMFSPPWFAWDNGTGAEVFLYPGKSISNSSTLWWVVTLWYCTFINFQTCQDAFKATAQAHATWKVNFSFRANSHRESPFVCRLWCGPK